MFYMSRNESGNGDEVATEVFTTINSQHSNEVNNRDSVDFQDSRSSDTISEQIETPHKSASRSSAMNFMKKWLKWILSLCILCVLILSLTLEKLKNFLPLRIKIWKWCLFVTVILHGIALSGVFMHLLLYAISEIVSSSRSQINFFYLGMKNSFRILIYLVLVLLTWLFVFNPIRIHDSKTSVKVKHYGTWTLVSAIIGAFLWVLKTLVFRSLSTRFQVFAFFTRIQESLFHQYIIYQLSLAPFMEIMDMVEAPVSNKNWRFKMFETVRKFGKEEVVISFDSLLKLRKDEVAAENMEQLVKACSLGMHYVSCSIEDFEMEDKEIKSEMEATAAAVNIFRNVAKPGCRYINYEDLLRFLTSKEANLVFPLFEGAKGGQINRKSLTDWVVKVYNGRKGLIHSLTDTKKSIKQLNILVIVILIIITIVVWLLLSEIATTTVLVFLTSQIVLAAFIFGDTCKRVFESVLFLFVLHPFDIGDRCIIDDIPLLVEKMNILTTVFLKLNNEIVYYPNSELSTKPIINLSRSNLGDVIQFSIASVPKEEMVIVKAKIKSYLEEKPQYWNRNHNVVITEIENGKSKLELHFNYVLNFEEFGEKTKRRSELVVGLMEIFEQLSVKYSLIPQLNMILPN